MKDIRIETKRTQRIRCVLNIIYIFEILKWFSKANNIIKKIIGRKSQ